MTNPGFKNYWNKIADELERVRKHLCTYQGSTCDCKFGIDEQTDLRRSEKTGCPELSRIIKIYRAAANNEVNTKTTEILSRINSLDNQT